MHTWATLLRMVHDNIEIIFGALLVAGCGVAWLVIEAVRSHQSRDEIFKLRQRVTELERERQTPKAVAATPVVMPDRWVRTGSAATTSDGGCLILVDRVIPLQQTALLSIRVDGYSVERSQPVRVGQRLEVAGKSGTYFVELYGTETSQIHVGVALRSKHNEYAQD